ncbi:glycosyltransferase [uncultured Flavobacterium sp.]|uniref:glycosyltransferase family 2 protein n=1 Tax=uncultured Flavobacterium sp. TaxID=165435 RepID=UPI0030ED1F38|tara:strand:- start:218816 stop:219919 length:1104 start_codon:yes stop_codon:yes gene_type:complete
MILIGFYTILFIYVLFIGAFIYGFGKMKSKNQMNVNPKTSFSIVVPFRNEAENLPQLLHSISLLDYPTELVEVILVDDESEEEFRIHNLEFRIQIIKNIRKTNSPKKDAINTAIVVAKNDWIITTDADCLVQNDWLKSIDNFIQTENKKMVAAGVSYLPKKGFLHQFQNLDFLSLQGVTIGSFGIEKPFMCNGANFAYEKAFFKDLNGFEGNSEIASGDDVFLLQKALQFDSKNVGFCTNKESIVATKSVLSWKELFFQRVRWASKSSAYVDWFSKSLALVVFLTNLFFVVSCMLWVVGLFRYENLLFYFGIKFLVDFIMIMKSANYFNQRIRYVLICSLVYPFFTSAVALYSLFGKYSWKGRSFRK